MKKRVFCASYLGAMVCIFAVQAPSQNTFLTWSTFDMGFGIPTSPNTVTTSALGQAFVGTSLHANTRLESGFLSDTLFRGTLVAVNEDRPLPAVFALEQNYPNPFNPTTIIEFRIQNSELTILKVFDLLGREIATLVNEVKEPGTYTVQWDASGFGSGVYFYRLQAGTFVATRKLLLLR